MEMHLMSNKDKLINSEILEWDETTGEWKDAQAEDKHFEMFRLYVQLCKIANIKYDDNRKCPICYSYTFSVFGFTSTEHRDMCSTCGYNPEYDKDMDVYRKKWQDGSLEFQGKFATFQEWCEHRRNGEFNK